MNKSEYNSKYNKQHSSEIKEYNKQNTTSINVRLSNSRDGEIIEYLKSVPNKVDLVRRLLLEHIKKQENNEQ